MIGFLKGYGWVQFYLNGIANILSLARVKKRFRVTFDSSADKEFHVYLSQGQVRSFKDSLKGLYYSDIRESDSATVLVNTVELNKPKYSNRDYLCALNTRKTTKHDMRNYLRTIQADCKE